MLVLTTNPSINQSTQAIIPCFNINGWNNLECKIYIKWYNSRVV